MIQCRIRRGAPRGDRACEGAGAEGATQHKYTLDRGGIARRGGSDELSFGPFIHLHRPPLMSTVLQVVAEDEREEPAVADDGDDFLWARA